MLFARSLQSEVQQRKPNHGEFLLHPGRSTASRSCLDAAIPFHAAFEVNFGGTVDLAARKLVGSLDSMIIYENWNSVFKLFGDEQRIPISRVSTHGHFQSLGPIVSFGRPTEIATLGRRFCNQMYPRSSFFRFPMAQ